MRMRKWAQVSWGQRVPGSNIIVLRTRKRSIAQNVSQSNVHFADGLFCNKRSNVQNVLARKRSIAQNVSQSILQMDVNVTNVRTCKTFLHANVPLRGTFRRVRI